MKVLILVLSAQREPWGQLMQTSMETWDSEHHPQTQTIYYCGASSGKPPEKVFYSASFGESLEEVAGRTMEAFEYSLTIPDWNFIARSHSSTYVHKGNLVEFIETLPKENVLCGLLTTGLEPFLWGGGGYIISRDVVEKFVANKDKWNLKIMEDNAITNLANELDVPLMGKGRMASINGRDDGSYFCMTYRAGDSFNFSDWSEAKKIHPHYFIRCKQDMRREQDLEIMRQLHKHL